MNNTDFRTNDHISACGLLCNKCPLLLAAWDKEKAKVAREWFLSEGWLDEKPDLKDFMEEAPFCEGCQGNREKHWSPSCEILLCCVDEKGLENCSQCPKLPCDKLKKHSSSSEQYKSAVERLKKLRAKQKSNNR